MVQVDAVETAVGYQLDLALHDAPGNHALRKQHLMQPSSLNILNAPDHAYNPSSIILNGKLLC